MEKKEYRFEMVVTPTHIGEVCTVWVKKGKSIFARAKRKK